jgi:hypothetical protein
MAGHAFIDLVREAKATLRYRRFRSAFPGRNIRTAEAAVPLWG